MKIKYTLFLLLFFCNRFIFSQNKSGNLSLKNNEIEPPEIGKQFKPTIGLGTGAFTFFGDLYKKHAQPFATSRTAFELSLTQTIDYGLNINFYTLFGKLGANERLGFRNENFESEIRLGGIQLYYDFKHFVPAHHIVRPWVSTGIEGFEFLSKTDLKDKNGQTYHYWSDGTIRNKAEDAFDAKTATRLYRDYEYETDIRELNADGKGKYPERSWAIPLGAGVLFHISDNIQLKLGTTFHFTFTDEIDGISSESKGYRAGNKNNDRFVMTSLSLHYTFGNDNVSVRSEKFKDVDFLALMTDDEDGDGVTDFKDMCHQTPAGVKVDKFGCPVDEDDDMIPDYYDQELPTPKGMIANGLGIGITDAMAKAWYKAFYDSTAQKGKTVYLDSAKQKDKNKDAIAQQRKEYTVELASFKGGVPDDVMAFLLSIGDVRSTEIGDETIFYTAGSYEDINLAIQRQQEFIANGFKEAKVGYFQGDQYFPMDNSSGKIKEEIAVSDSVIAKKGHHEEAKFKTDNHGVFYRVQLGAYKNQLAKTFFKHTGKVIELKTEDNYHKYVTESYPDLKTAMLKRAELVIDGYADAFVTAYKNGKRISLAEAGATFENKTDAANEDLSESKNKKSALDKSFVIFKVQIGSLKKSNDKVFEERIKDLKDVHKSFTSSGLTRYTLGEFHDYKSAQEEKNKVADTGFNDAFVIATFNGDVISIQEALEIMGEQK
jgi:hypothetical protein